MAIDAKLDLAFAELTQAQKAGQARAILQNVRQVIIESNQQLQAISDSGSLSTVDAEILAALVAGWNIIKSGETAFDNGDLPALLDWRP